MIVSDAPNCGVTQWRIQRLHLLSWYVYIKGNWSLCYKPFYSRHLQTFAHSKHFQPSLMFESKARTYRSRKNFMCSTNITLGWKVLTRTNTLAYYKHSKITTVKSFIRLGTGGCIKKLFYSPYKFCTVLSKRVTHFHPILIYSRKARNLSFKWRPIMGSTKISSGFDLKYDTRVKVNATDKHSSLHFYGINCGSKKLNNTGYICQSYNTSDFVKYSPQK
jgi:hypothetical protein